VLHFTISVEPPTHGRPPLDGAGLLHVLERFRLPPPHVTGHTDHPDQILQSPLTCIEYNLKFSANTG